MGCKLITATLKSASTYIWHCVGRAARLPLTHIPGVPGVPANRTDFLESAVATRELEPDYVARMHMTATPRNVDIINKYQIPVVVVVRNIADSLVSMDDHIQGPDHPIGVPMGALPHWYATSTESDRLLYLANLHSAWYISFATSWVNSGIPVTWLTYSSFVKNPDAAIADILTGLQLPKGRRRRLPTSTALRYNKGKIGRGERIPAAGRNTIAEACRCARLPGWLTEELIGAQV